jgi:hypothetical protein
MELPETETRLTIRRAWNDPASLETELAWPPAGDLDLGTIILEKDGG